MTLPAFRSESPTKVNASVRPLVAYLGLNADRAVQLKYAKPSTFEPEHQNCHLNVWCQLQSEGGSTQHGWVLTADNSQAFAEAIFHTVWARQDGRLVDVTPRSDQEKRLLFVPDDDRAIELSAFEGRPAINTFDNVRLHHGEVATPLRRIQIVMQSDFAARHGLWPW